MREILRLFMFLWKSVGDKSMNFAQWLLFLTGIAFLWSLIYWVVMHA
nr:MAG TPA: N-terminal domain of cytochrome oxidase-cbb3, FixP [Caudoviricetes sp.]DAI64464.1 MAG TPA: N-terminal domain of cytochrome oxidase-cbb3, FixP [Caudoviricetes sp.]